MAEKEKVTQEEMDNLEDKLITNARNLPSGSYAADGVVVTFKRPKLLEKYRARVWANTKLRAIGVENLDEDEQGLVYYYRFLGALCMNVATITREDGTEVLLKKGDPYEFLLEKYLEEDINEKGLSEDNLIKELSDAYYAWENQTPTEDDLKKS